MENIKLCCACSIIIVFIVIIILFNNKSKEHFDWKRYNDQDIRLHIAKDYENQPLNQWNQERLYHDKEAAKLNGSLYDRNLELQYEKNDKQNDNNTVDSLTDIDKLEMDYGGATLKNILDSKKDNELGLKTKRTQLNMGATFVSSLMNMPDSSIEFPWNNYYVPDCAEGSIGTEVNSCTRKIKPALCQESPVKLQNILCNNPN